MKLMERKPARKKEVKYPDMADVRRNRRQFLNMLGKGVLAASLLGLSKCVGKIPLLNEDGGLPPGDDTWEGETGEGDQWNISGGAPREEVTYPPRIEVGGVAPAEIEEQYAVPGDGGGGGIDVHSPDGCTYPADAEGEFPPLPGEQVEPDATPQEPDTGEPPLAGDLPAPDLVSQPDSGSTEKDVKPEVDTEEPPLDGDQAEPTW